MPCGRRVAHKADISLVKDNMTSTKALSDVQARVEALDRAVSSLAHAIHSRDKDKNAAVDSITASFQEMKVSKFEVQAWADGLDLLGSRVSRDCWLLTHYNDNDDNDNDNDNDCD